MHRLLICASLLLCTHQAQAAFFCVNNSSTLTSALATAASNGQDDEIRMKSGNYPTGATRFEVLGESGRNLKISGGWIDFISPCSLQTGKPDDTVLTADALAGVQVMRVRTPVGASGSITLGNMSMIQGRGFGSNAGCMNIEVATGTMLVTAERIAISGCFNGQTLSPSALSISHEGTGRAVFRDSIISSNGSQSGAAVYLNTFAGGSIISFRNNSVVANQVASSAPLSAGVQARDFSSSVNSGIEIYDSVMAGNGATNQFDLTTLGTQSQIFTYYNVLSKPIDGASVAIQNRIAADPAILFVNYPSDLRPRPASILRDGGNTDPVPGLGEVDHNGFPRIQNRRLDVGAIEFEALLSDGFE